jgi:pimeloyl-ACP methyl ester carboxylesterase
MQTATTDFVTSQDGTTIGYRRFGRGPGIILLHGGMKSSNDFRSLAELLSDAFTSYVPDRRGRGLSGPHGAAFSVVREVEDVQALIAKTEATNLFGLSSGALVALRTALATPSLRKVALYEPPLSIDGSVPVDWVPRYERELAEGRLAAALVTALKETQIEPLFASLPRWLLEPFIALGLRVSPQGNDVSIRALIPTQRFDMQIVAEMADTLEDYRSLGTQLFLLGGSKSPAYLKLALDHLAATLPHNKCLTLPGLGHDGPENDGKPESVANELRRFFSESGI